MSKARDLADSVSTGGILEDGAVSVSEISDLTVTAAELNNVAGVNSDVQTQLDLKAPLASPTFTGTVTADGLTVDGGLTLNADLDVVDVKFQSTANAKVKVVSSTTGNSILMLGDTDDNDIGMIDYDNANNSMRFVTNTSEAMRINSSGNVGIGATSPATKVDINNGTSDSLLTLTTNSFDGTARTGVNFQVNGFANTPSGQIALVGDNNYSGNMVFSTANPGTTNPIQERMRISSTGAIGLSGANYGTAGQVLTSGGSGAAPTWADAGGGGGVFDMTATGAITSGDLVALNTDGTVSSVGASTSLRNNPVNFANSSKGTKDVARVSYDPDNSIVGVSGNDSNGPYFQVHYGENYGSGSSILNLDSRDQSTGGSSLYDTTNDKFIAVYTPNGGDGNSGIFAKVITASESGSDYSISAGSAYSLRDDGVANRLNQQYSVWDAETGNAYCIQSRDNGNTSVIAFSISSGSTLSVGSSVEVVGNAYNNNSVVYDTDTNQLIVCWYDSGSTIHFRLGTVSGQTISLNALNTSNDVTLTGTQFSSDTHLFYDTNVGKLIFIYDDYGSGSLKIRLGTVTSNSISWGSDTVIYDAGTNVNAVKAQSISIEKIPSTTDKFLLTYVAQQNSTAYGNILTITGSSITVGSQGTLNTSVDSMISLAIDTSKENNFGQGVTFTRIGQTGYVTSISYANTTSNNQDFIGIAGEAISNGSTGEIKLLGNVDDQQSGLTPKSVYYADTDGSLTTTNTGAKVGTALTSSAILITRPD